MHLLEHPLQGISIALIFLWVMAACTQGSVSGSVSGSADMTDAERVAAVNAVWDSHGDFVHLKPAPVDELLPQNERGTIQCRIIMADGSTPPASLSLLHVHDQGSRRPGRIVKRFELTLSGGVGNLPAYHGDNNYAMIASDQYQLPAQELGRLKWSAANSPADGLTFTLHRGIDHRLVILDSAGNPLEGAEVTLASSIGYNSSQIKGVTDPSGSMSWQDLSTGRINATISAPGYGSVLWYSLALEAGPNHVMTMLPEIDCQVQVTNVDGVPCSDARFEMIAMYKGGHTQDLTSVPRVISSSIVASGRFRLHQLGHDGVAVIRVKNDSGFAYFTAAPGKVIPVSLRPFKRVQLTVRNPELLPRSSQDNQPYVTVSAVTYVSSGFSSSTSKDYSIIIRDGQGHLEVSGLWHHRVDIEAGGSRTSVDLNDSMTEVAIAATPLPLKIPSQLTPVSIAVEPARAFNHGWLDVREQPIGEQYDSHWHLPAQEAAAGITVSAPCKLQVSSRYLRGWYFSPVRLARVEPSAEPQMIVLEAEPAGLIHGHVVLPPGADNSSLVQMSIIEIVDTKPSRLGKIVEAVMGTHRDRRYLSTPVPLGANWKIRATHGASLYISDAVIVTASRPVLQSNIVFLPGADLTVTVLDRDDQPIVGANVSLVYKEDGHSLHFGTITTTHDGTGVLRNINAQVPGTYGLTVNVWSFGNNEFKRLDNIDLTSGEISVHMGND